jgi:hypothetical protein
MQPSSLNSGRLATAVACLTSLLSLALHTHADSVTWGGDPAHTPNSSYGILDATQIQKTNTDLSVPGVRYSDVNNDGYDIVVLTTGLNKTGVDLFESQPTWWFEGGTRSTTATSISYSTVEFQFYNLTKITNTPVTGVHFRLQDAETEERFRNFSYLDAAGLEVSINSNNPIFTYSQGHPTNHLSDGSFDNGASYASGTQAGKWIDINLSNIPISGFKFQVGRSLSSYGSVLMTGLGNIIPYVEAAPAVVQPGGDYRGITGISPSGVGTLASLLDGTASLLRPVQMDFNVGPGAANQFFAQSGTVRSDVLTLQGTAGDKFVLQLSYDDTGMSLAQENALLLMWYNPTSMTFVPAVEGNLGVSEVSPGVVAKLGAYNRSTDFLLGNFGVDTENNTVWAVIDHNSDFAIVETPEPTSAILAICGALPLLARRRRARSAT